MKVIGKYFKIYSLIILSITYLLVFSVSCGASEEPNGSTAKESAQETSTPATPEEAACQQSVDGFFKAALTSDVDAAMKTISSSGYTEQEITDNFAEARQFYDGYESIETTDFKINESKDPIEAEYRGTVWYEGGLKGWIFVYLVEEEGTWLIRSFSLDVEQAKKEK